MGEGMREAAVDNLADWLGEMPESRNVFDHTDEATTVISIDVETLARRIAVEIHNSVAARLAVVAAALDDSVTPSLPTAEWVCDPLPSNPNYASVNPDWLRALIREAKAVRALLEEDA